LHECDLPLNTQETVHADGNEAPMVVGVRWDPSEPVSAIATPACGPGARIAYAHEDPRKPNTSRSRLPRVALGHPQHIHCDYRPGLLAEDRPNLEAWKPDQDPRAWKPLTF
jgi:hypothetical protein